MERIHLIGIGGSGLSAIARVLLESGYPVSGSDREASAQLIDLQQAGARIFNGHEAMNVEGAELVIRSSAVPDSNVEVQTALALGIPVLKRGDFLGRLMEGRLGIAVAGTHGKTTTTAMIAWTLVALNQDPSFIIGSHSANLGSNARAGQGPAFVIEADEYDHMFLGLNPKIAVVTNVEHDHPDCYPTAQDFQAAFLDFASRLLPDGVLLACADDAGSRLLLEQARRRGQSGYAYGLIPVESSYQARNLILHPSVGYAFEAWHAGDYLANLALQVPGEHNVRNALACLAVIDQLGLSVKQAAQALQEFKGASRRFEVLGQAGGVTVIDDYAHHPTEIRATLAAARQRYPGQELWAVWQPHTYSRTRALFDDFVTAFGEADHVVVTEIYAAREAAPPDLSARQVVDAMQRPTAEYAPDLDWAKERLLEQLKPGDVLLVMSAGDADRLSRQVLAELERLKA